MGAATKTVTDATFDAEVLGSDVPVLVDNDVNVLALGEHAVSWPLEDDLLFVKVSTGIGMGIISGGRLQRGAANIAVRGALDQTEPNVRDRSGTGRSPR